jgi:hypothetical protein
MKMLQDLQISKELAMNRISGRMTLFVVAASMMMLTYTTGSAEDEFNSEKIISELEKQMDVSLEKWEQLKPVISEKSEELSKQMKGSIDRGYAELDELARKFDLMSKDAEQKVKDILSSEEAMKFRETLAKIDKKAIDEAKNKMIADLNELLDLTEDQARKIKPILEESFTEMSEKISELRGKGEKNWEDFKKDFEKLTSDLYDKVQDILNDEQIEKLELFNQKQEGAIKQALFDA